MITHIATVSQLNAFIGTVKIDTPDKIITELAASNILVNHDLAALLAKQSVSVSKPFSSE